LIPVLALINLGLLVYWGILAFAVKFLPYWGQISVVVAGGAIAMLFVLKWRLTSPKHHEKK
jgi:hypothetical protein